MTVAYVSPYSGITPDKWAAKTSALLKKFPLEKDEIVKPILEAWDSILSRRLDGMEYRSARTFFRHPK